MEKKEMIKKLMEKVNDNIKKSNKEMMRLPGKAKQYVDQSMTSVQSAVSSLQQALGNAEKAENKVVIQQAITSLNSACGTLSKYKD